MIDSTENRKFPFRSVLSLELLVEYWEQLITAGKVPFGEPLLQYLALAPELREPIADRTVIERHRDLVNFLMSAAIAPAQSQKELTVATVPFHFDAIFASEAFQRTIDLSQIARSATVNIPGQDLLVGKTIQACLFILQEFYNVNLHFDKRILFTVRDPEMGLGRVYKVDISRQFCQIVKKREPRPIDPKIIKFLTEKVYDLDLWLQYIQPDDFEFRGFMVMRMVDVTEQEMVSSMKYDLLEKHAVSRKGSFAAIQQKLRSVFGLPDIQLGLAYLDFSNNIVLNSDDHDCWRSLADGGESPICKGYEGSVYERSWMEKRYISVEDLESYPYKSYIEERLLAKGIRSILLAPLIDEGETIGMLELATPHAGELNPITAHKVESVLPMFTAAVKRVKEETVTEIRAIIQEECTNVHPVVQWRFLEAARKVLEKRRRGEAASFEAITFKDVYPLFGMADIRNSSLERMTATQEDLLQNLQMARTVLKKIYSQNQLPFLDETLYKANGHIDKITNGIDSGDESTVIEFLKREIHPIFDHFKDEAGLAMDIASYRKNIDPDFGVVYRKRRDFENSLSMINSMISSSLNEAQATAQQMFPHYFEKYQTDGMEYTIYLGSALTREKTFNLFFLKNFRLWQLLTACEIESGMERLRPRLKTPLEIAQLILVHDRPLSIRFRPDEKHFDVDGAYDIRYEIIKKRIDKATIKGSGERLTQPGKIAVIYNEPRVEVEYRRYFDYLMSRGMINGKIEALELEELPGATGLRALRIDVTQPRQNPRLNSATLLRDIESAVQLN